MGEDLLDGLCLGDESDHVAFASAFFIRKDPVGSLFGGLVIIEITDIEDWETKEPKVVTVRCAC